MKILLAVDGSDATQRMLAYLAAHKEFLGSTHDYTALTVVPPLSGRAASVLPVATLESWHAEQADAVLKPVSDFAAMQGWTLRPRYVVGHAGEQIARIAQEEGAELIMMGTHGHGALVNMVMGSVATSVLARSRVPVLLVH
jgi:nucleotide-binding universal stress UspA family protein